MKECAGPVSASLPRCVGWWALYNTQQLLAACSASPQFGVGCVAGGACTTPQHFSTPMHTHQAYSISVLLLQLILACTTAGTISWTQCAACPPATQRCDLLAPCVSWFDRLKEEHTKEKFTPCCFFTLLKYFWAWLRIWMVVLVCTCCATLPHDRP